MLDCWPSRIIKFGLYITAVVILLILPFKPLYQFNLLNKVGRNIKNTFRKLRTSFGRHGRPTEPGIRWIVNRFEETGSVEGRRPYQHARPARTRENVAAVSESVREGPTTSTRRRSQQLGISDTTLRRILHIDLHLHPYKIQLTQELKPADHQQRRVFVNWLLEREDGFSAKVLFSDEAHFHLNGYVNKQNCRFWGAENPHEFHEQPLHPEKVTVWCGLWAGGIVGPFFFEDAEEKAITVNGERYRGIITDFLWPQLDRIGADDLWFQQEGCNGSHSSSNDHLIAREISRPHNFKKF